MEPEAAEGQAGTTYCGNRAGADWSVFGCSQPEILGVLGIWPKVEGVALRSPDYPSPPPRRGGCETWLECNGQAWWPSS